MVDFTKRYTMYLLHLKTKRRCSKLKNLYLILLSCFWTINKTYLKTQNVPPFHTGIGLDEVFYDWKSIRIKEEEDVK